MQERMKPTWNLMMQLMNIADYCLEGSDAVINRIKLLKRS
jgi:hypothetical protein